MFYTGQQDVGNIHFFQYLLPNPFFSFAGLQILHGNLLLCSADYCVRSLLCFKVILTLSARRLSLAYRSVLLYIQCDKCTCFNDYDRT